MPSRTDPVPPAADPPNGAIASAFEELGDLYELDGAIVHRVVAYRSAAKAVRDAPVSVAALAREGRATELPGVGATLQQKILDLLQTGTIPAAEKLRAKFPPGLIDLTRLPGLGPKRARRLFDELGIDSLAALREAAEAHRLRELRGFGPKFEATVLEALAAGVAERVAPRVLLHRATGIGEQIVAGLQARVGGPGVRIALAGSARRQADSVKDLDIIASGPDPQAVAAALADLDIIESCERAGPAGARGRTHTGLAVELRVVAEDQFGNLLQHLTGSKEHNMALREAAVRRGLHVSEYGVLDDATGKTHRCTEETEVYELLGLKWIEPELRENRGELGAAFEGGAGLPELITLEQIRGDLHCHTTASDGRNSIEQMAQAALARGYEYLAITDHSATHGFGNDVSPSQLERQIERVHEANEQIEGIRLLAGTEVNILPDGSPDYADELLEQLDWVIASVHTAFGSGEAEMTKRMVAAIEHPLIDAIGHPTGRLIERRAPYPVDLEAVIEAAARTNTMLEINANPDRRDLSDVHARQAARCGVPIVINSDAHGINTFGVMRWGIATARRAWLGPAEVANTLPWSKFGPLRKRARKG
ncbi:MAG TPA: DNA polymerase/3'-5' exonuclease PolX [Solirubrobacteraceae bacterium]|nr:DNA polymerase/3'-5' exonuclease PolX [Solirubrobacteraceae bacterium]